MSVLPFQHGRGTTDKLDVYVGEPGEVLFDTVTKQLCVQDGSTQGGIRMAKDLPMRGATVFTAGAQGLVPAPAVGDQLKFLRADGSWQVPVDTTYTFTNNNATLAWDSTVTLAVVGGVSITAKLPASPVVEFTPATATPLAAGTATVGTSDKYAREDHVHPAQTSVSGNAGTATKLATARSLKVALGSTTAVTFDGSAAQDAIPVTGTLAVANGGTGQTSVANIKAGKDAAGNTITETYATKTDLENLSRGLVQYVPALPTTGTEGVLYLVETTAGSNTYNKYTWENGAFVYLGVTQLDLSNYVVKADAIKALEVSGRVITYTRADGTNGTITTQDSNTTYSAGTGLTLASNSFSLNTAGSALGGVKTTSTVTSTSGLTACPIIAGVPYYKDTNTTYTLSSLGIGNVKNYDQSKAIVSITRSGTTFTYTCLDGTTGTFTQQDNNTTYSAGTGLTVTNNSFSLNTANSALGGVKTTSTVTSTSGLTACPIISGVVYYKNTTYSVATTSANGLMSKTDKANLDNLVSQMATLVTQMETFSDKLNALLTQMDTYYRGYTDYPRS